MALMLSKWLGKFWLDGQFKICGKNAKSCCQAARCHQVSTFSSTPTSATISMSTNFALASSTARHINQVLTTGVLVSLWQGQTRIRQAKKAKTFGQGPPPWFVRCLGSLQQCPKVCIYIMSQELFQLQASRLNQQYNDKMFNGKWERWRNLEDGRWIMSSSFERNGV